MQAAPPSTQHGHGSRSSCQTTSPQELPSSAGFRRKERERGIAGEWIMFTSERHAQGSVVAMDTAQVDWSASVMRDTTKKLNVSPRQHFFSVSHSLFLSPVRSCLCCKSAAWHKQTAAT
uniref:Uncharacterized protein n=1 Tax=Cyprinodon variegatus TaxID=28743 RepID=A0A3Q2E122_CYPVA